MERAIALGRCGMADLNGPLSKTAAIARLREPPPTPDHSWRVEGVTADGRRWVNGVRLGSREEAEAYIEGHVRFDLEKQGYANGEIVRCDEPPSAHSITRVRKGGRTTLLFAHGTCGALDWHPQGDEIERSEIKSTKSIGHAAIKSAADRAEARSQARVCSARTPRQQYTSEQPLKCEFNKRMPSERGKRSWARPN
jgi:hypothetical protein